jgi:hypothetical protein
MASKVHSLKTGLLAVTSAVALGVAALGISTSAAHAEDNKPQENNLSCEIRTPNGGTFYPPGTEISVTVDGKTEKYRCDGATGKWVLVARAIGDLNGVVLNDDALQIEPGVSVRPQRPRAIGAKTTEGVSTSSRLQTFSR